MVKKVNMKKTNNYSSKNHYSYNRTERKNNFKKEFKNSNTMNTNSRDGGYKNTNYQNNHHTAKKNYYYFEPRDREDFSYYKKPKANRRNNYNRRNTKYNNSSNTTNVEKKYMPFQPSDTHLSRPVTIPKTNAPDYSIEGLKKHIDNIIDKTVDTMFFDCKRYTKTQKIKAGAIATTIELSPKYNPEIKKSLLIIINKDIKRGLFNMSICNGSVENLNILFTCMDAYLVPKVDKYLPVIIQSTENILREQLSVFQSNTIKEEIVETADGEKYNYISTEKEVVDKYEDDRFNDKLTSDKK